MVDLNDGIESRSILRASVAFLSGAVSLNSQLLALRIAQQELSATEVTAAAVLAAALGGLAIGAICLSQFTARIRQDCFAEVLLLGASVLVAMIACHGRGFARWLAEMEIGLTVETAVFALMLVMPVNFLVGGVVPVLADSASTNRIPQKAAPFAWVYAFETLGAASGSLLLTFFAVPVFGLKSSGFAFAVFVASMAIISIVASGKSNSSSETTMAEDGARKLMMSRDISPDSAKVTDAEMRQRSYLLVAAIIGGSASLGMELIWQRHFAIMFGSDTHSYAVVAAVYLCGISAGSMLASLVCRFCVATVRLYAWLLALFGVSILVSMWILNIGFEVESFRGSLTWLENSPLLARVCLAGAVILLPSVLQGIVLPVLVRIWAGSNPSSTTNSGSIYGAAIFGNIAGVLVCALLLIPVLGLELSAFAFATFCLFGATGLMIVQGSNSLKGKIHIGGVGCLLIVGSGLAFCRSSSPQYPGLNLKEDWVVDYYTERSSNTIAVLRSTNDKSRKQLLMDGVTIGETGGGVEEKQQMLAHLPFLISEFSKPKVLTIGLGTGLLAAELAEMPQVESVVCYELSKAVIDASRLFVSIDDNELLSSKLKVQHGDGIRFLRKTQQKFDVIVSDGKSRPGASSNLHFFTEEYYQLCASRLTQAGVFIQWVSLRCDRKELKTILSTFANNFVDGRIAIASDSVYLVGLNQPLDLDAAVMERHLDEACAESLNAFGWSEPDDFLSMGWLRDDETLLSCFRIQANTLDRPVLEAHAWNSFRHSIASVPPQRETMIELIDAAIYQSSENTEHVHDWLVACRELIKVEEIVGAAKGGWLDEATSKFKAAMQILPRLGRHKAISVPFRELARNAQSQQNVSQEYSALINLSEINATTPTEELRIAEILVDEGQSDLALQHAYNATKKSGGEPRFTFELGRLCLRCKKYGQALRRFEEVIAATRQSDAVDQPNWHAHATLLKGLALQKLSQVSQGKLLVQAMLEKFPALQELYSQHSSD